MLDLTIHRYTLRRGDHVEGHFSNIPVAVVTGYARCSLNPIKRAAMLNVFTVEERGTGNRDALTNHNVSFQFGIPYYIGRAN